MTQSLLNIVKLGGEWSRALLGIWALIVALVAGGVFVVNMARAMIETVEGLQSDIALLLRSHEPDIAIFSKASYVREPCYNGTVCYLVVVARRTAEGLTCVLDPTQTRIWLVSDADLREYILSTVPADKDPVNIGTTLTTLELKVLIPGSAPAGSGEVFVETQYRECPWHIDEQDYSVEENGPIRATITRNPELKTEL